MNDIGLADFFACEVSSVMPGTEEAELCPDVKRQMSDVKNQNIILRF